MTLKDNVSVILLAGGKGTRIKSTSPKQYLLLKNKLMARHSFEVFLSTPNIKEIIVVCEPAYQHYFATDSHVPILFALPGERRQDSVFNGLEKVSADTEWVCIHDSARPLINSEIVNRVIDAACEVGAATTGMPLKFTVKESNAQCLVKKTLDRSLIWEIQTPQVIKIDLLKRGFNCANKNNLTVTDDVSLVELLGLPVKLVEGSDCNIKVTTSQDLVIAEHFMEKFSPDAEHAKL